MTVQGFGRWLTLASYTGLLILVTLWPTVLVMPREIPVAWALLLGLTPLLIPLRGVLHGRRRSHLWLALIALAYFVHGTTEAAAASPARLYGVIEALLATGVVVGAAAYLRAR